MTEECLERIKKHNNNINKLEEKLIKEREVKEYINKTKLNEKLCDW